MRIEWVNHASFIIEHGPIRLLSDPWIEGTVFDQGWALLSPSSFTYSDFANITHIWFSHEHPDHFNTPNLRFIPSEFRSKITVLYQKTEDKKVRDYCCSLGFHEVIELDKQHGYDLTDDFQVRCTPIYGDSWLCMRVGGQTILNLNDCNVHTKEDVLKMYQLVGPIDVLLTQFSYANWVGNRADIRYRTNMAREKMNTFLLQTNLLKPRYVIPFASYVWFCHEENYYLNAEMNQIEDVVRRIKQETMVQPVVLYPGDTWEMDQHHDSRSAITRYQRDYHHILNRPKLVQNQSFDIELLSKIAKQFSDSLIQLNDPSVTNYLLQHPTTLFLTDNQLSYQFGLQHGLQRIDVYREDCDIALSAEALYYCFAHLWGGDTLIINGRFQIPNHGDYINWRKFFLVSSLHYRQISFQMTDLIRILNRVSQRITNLQNHC
ncbi:MBL fold metallo-hydrolase [Paenibacillus sp. KN14-4R]|uniref:MBL fold metallo-hydrolase n=1 Tax=Paenibacillus sp. KN14-4R TaxID=3445773 RepID=UPI003FA0FAA7